MFFPPLPLLLIHSLLRRRAGCGAMTPGLVAGCSSRFRGLWCPGIKPPPFLFRSPNASDQDSHSTETVVDHIQQSTVTVAIDEPMATNCL